MLWLPGNGLLSADKVSMAYSLEGRVPYFDRKLMELVAAIPSATRLKDNKYLLRAVMRDVLPEAIRSRPKKPFGTPIQAWFGTALRPQLREVLYDPAALQRPYFQQAAHTQLLDDHFAGRTSQPEIIWRLVNLEMWQRTFLDQRVEPPQ
jgi:asparagine synthase (glutamine-hydrolysing)